MFHNASKVVLCRTRTTFPTFSEDVFQFSWQAQHFGDLHRHFAWQAQHFRRVTLPVFCESHCQGCVKWHFLKCDENWRKPRTKHRFWGSKSRFKRKFVGKRRFWSYTMWKLEDVSREMLVLMLQHVSSRVESLVFWPSRIYGGSRTSLLFDGFRTGCNVVLRGRRATSWHSHMSAKMLKAALCARRNTFASLSTDELHLSWRAQHFGHVHRRFAWHAQQFEGVLLRVLCESHCQGCVKWWQRANRVAGVACCDMRWHSTHYIPNTPHTPHFTLNTMHSTLHTSHSTLDTLYTSHSTLHTSHSALYTQHFTLHTLHSTLHTSHSALHTPRPINHHN